jgi:hypothetical protein
MSIRNNKSPAMNDFISNVQRRMFGRDDSGVGCVVCGSGKITPEDFKDELSAKEFLISHMCQVCQDDTFGEDVEDNFV